MVACTRCVLHVALAVVLVLWCSSSSSVVAQGTANSWRGGSILWRQVAPTKPNTIRVEFDLFTAWSRAGPPSASTLSINTFRLTATATESIHALTVEELLPASSIGSGILGVRRTSWEQIEDNDIVQSLVWVQDQLTFQLDFPKPDVTSTYGITLDGCCRPEVLYGAIPTASLGDGNISLRAYFRPSLAVNRLTSGEDVYIPPIIMISRGATLETDQSLYFHGLQLGELDSTSGTRSYTMEQTYISPTNLVTQPVWSSINTVPTISWRYTAGSSFGVADVMVGTSITMQYTLYRKLGNVIESAIPFDFIICMS
jgi:hypothetical protein